MTTRPDVPERPSFAVAPLLELERERVLELLAGLTPDDWTRPTPCPGWDVLDLVNHLIGGDVGVIAWRRDGHRGAVAPIGGDESVFITWLDALQADWVRSARRISPRLATQLLAWLGPAVVEVVAGEDPTSIDAHVSWASALPVPAWLDHARELTERWVHRQQLHDALGRPADLRADLLVPVLDAFRWAHPFRLVGHVRPAGAVVRVEVVSDGLDLAWTWRSDGAGRWAATEGTAGTAGTVHPNGVESIACLRFGADAAWRLLTNNLPAHRAGEVVATGDPEIVAALLATRAIIGDPAALPAIG